MEIEIGINANDREKIATGLSKLLADSYTLYLKTHNYHWNVTGPMFRTLHIMFEEQYTELSQAVDEIAERIRALGVKAPGSYKAFSQLSSIEEELDEPDAQKMLKRLVKAHETVSRTAKEMFSLASDAGDEPTIGLLSDRMQIHEKNAWMLRSMLE